MSELRGTVKAVGLKFDKDMNPVVLLTILSQDIDGATNLFKGEEVTVQSAQGRLALANSEED